MHRRPGPPSAHRLAALAAVALGLCVVGSGGPAAARPTGVGPSSIVSLGDSIASGEGTLYGWSFKATSGSWEGPSDPNPTWSGSYQDCHQSPDAYGKVVSSSYPKAEFNLLACTGSTFDKGIAGPWSATVPAQFGNWETRSGLNPVYQSADPDLVLVTLGADDVQFVDIVTQCAEYVYYHPTAPTQCTAKTPNGPNDVIKKDFIDYLPTLEHHLTTLISWIEARHDRVGQHVAPIRIVFTTYPDPLPSDAPAGGKNFCPDTWLFYNDQLTYLSSLVHVLDQHIVDTVTAYAKAHHESDVHVVDLANLYDGHQWCAKDSSGAYSAPWAYGMSIYHHYWDLRNPNPAAFHPTPEGQRQIAAKVDQTVKDLFGH